jgi:hypothetical protein
MGENGFKQQDKKLQNPRTLHDMVVAGSTCYLVGGSTNAGGTAAGAIATIEAAQVFSDGSIGDFKVVGYLPAARVQGDTIVADGKWLIQLGGQDTGGTSQSTIYVAQLDSNGRMGTFRTFTFTKATMIGHRLVYAKGYVYVIGGGAANQQEVYYAKLLQDGSFGPWKSGPDLPGALMYPAAVSDDLGSVIFVTGGMISTTAQDTIYRAFVNQDGSLTKWTFVGSLTATRWRHASVLVGNNLYSLGGSPDNVANSALATTEFSKINSDWTVGKSFRTGQLFTSLRNVEVALLPNFHLGKLVVCGGHFSSGNGADTVNVGSIQGDGHL